MPLLLLLLATAAAADIVLTDVRLWDGTGAPVVDDAWIAVDGTSITAVGTGAPPDGPQVDVGGRTVIPGLIDAHTHPWVVPGAGIRGDDEATQDLARRQGLRAFVACGVTTVLDAASPYAVVETLQGWQQAGLPAPRMLFLGPTVAPTDGYVDAFLDGYPGVDSLEAAEVHLDRMVELGAAGVKLTIEPGFVFPVLPVHDDALRQQIAAAAAARDLPVFVHAQHRDAHEAALAISPKAILHMVRERPGDLPERIAAAGVPVVPTLNVDATARLHGEMRAVEDPLAQLVIPWNQRRTAQREWTAYGRGMAHAALPHSSAAITSLAAFLMPTRDFIGAALKRTLDNTRRLHAAGVTLVMGSDSGAFDVVPYYFHGISSLREVALLAEAGLTPEEALLAATRDAAELLDLTGRAGVIAPGADADLVVLDADPLVDPAALRQVHAVMLQGELRTPRGWMRGPDRMVK